MKTPMPADNSHHIVAAARHRAAATRKRAISALRRMDNTSIPISFGSLACEAQVSRSWLYSQPDLRAEIERLRARHQSAHTRRPTAQRQHASEASLLRRLETATTRIRQLETENQQLRESLALALGEQRAANIRGNGHDTPRQKSAPIIEPC